MLKEILCYVTIEDTVKFRSKQQLHELISLERCYVSNHCIMIKPIEEYILLYILVAGADPAFK